MLHPLYIIIVIIVYLGLQNVRNNYREQKKIFDEALAHDDDSSEIDPDEIDFLVDDLFKLEINGKTLKSIVDNIKSKAVAPRPNSAASSKTSSGKQNNYSKKLPFIQTRSTSFLNPTKSNSYNSLKSPSNAKKQLVDSELSEEGEE